MRCQKRPLNQQWDDVNWDVIREIRHANSKLLEQMRIDGKIGSSLDAAVNIYIEDESYQKLHMINAELRFVLITSRAQLLPITERTDKAVACQLENTTVYIDAQVASGEKCVRCLA